MGLTVGSASSVSKLSREMEVEAEARTRLSAMVDLAAFDQRPELEAAGGVREIKETINA